MSEHTPGPWEYIASTEHHGPYVSGPYGGDVCDCYTMSNLSAASVRNGGDSSPIPFQGDAADANARLIAAAPDLLEALQGLLNDCVEYCRINNLFNNDGGPGSNHGMRQAHAAIAKATGTAP
jgi:hypothetical protein